MARKAPAEPSDSLVNLGDATVMLLESSQHSLDVLSQIVFGLGVREVIRCMTVEEADKALARSTVDLILMNAVLKEGDAYEFVRRLRRSKLEPNCYAPIIMTHGHVRKRDLGRMRDAGVNFVIAKPITPQVLLERTLWIGRDKRPFFDNGAYVGPDRRFKFEGPPPGTDGRRGADLNTPIGEVAEPNLSQVELDQMLKPQRVSL